MKFVSMAGKAELRKDASEEEREENANEPGSGG
jgi:hypothetical protein